MTQLHILVETHDGADPRYRVRGLLGNRAMAVAIETALQALPGVRARASAASGRVRATTGGGGGARDIERVLARVASEWLGADVAVLPSGASTVPAVRPARPVGRERPEPPEPPEPPERPEPPDRPRRGARAVPGGAGVDSAHAIGERALMARLKASREGLSEAHARERLARDGPNELQDLTGRGDLEILLGQFQSVPVALLAGSGALSLATRAVVDAAAIGAVLAANAGIGFVTERRAEQTVASLRKLAPVSATVLRDGKPEIVPATRVVVGDVLLLRPGEPIAADARVIESHRLSANEAALTGESLPVRKEPSAALAVDAPVGERRSIVHMGTVVSGGTGRAVVVATGACTALGAIRALAQGAQAPHTRLQVELDGLGRRLAIGSVLLCAGVFGLGIVRGRPLKPLMRTVVSLGVAAIPEGLPAVATSLLASGIRSLQGRQVYARSLDAVENLGSVDVVCLDKTGTITENRMRVVAATTGLRRHALEGEVSAATALPRDGLLVAALCNDCEFAEQGWHGSSTEIALIELAQAHGLDARRARDALPLIETKQRSEHHPYMVTLHRESTDRRFVAAKGRPAEVLERCSHWFDGTRVVRLRPADRARLLRHNDEMADLGQRVLALACARQRARRLGETAGLTWLGLVGLADPIRPRMDATIERFRAAGVRPVMITGDQPGTARTVAARIGVEGAGALVDAARLPESAAGLREVIESATVFARSTPGMKLQIVRALQAEGHVVAMTGDGINDGPALKAADVGVAMGATGTEFAHAMSDLVLRDDHPEGLLTAIAEGRTAYRNVAKAVRYLLATNLSELAATAVAIGVGLPEPFDPMALLWTNLITDVSPAIALGLEPAEPDVMQRPPVPRNGGILGERQWRALGWDAALLTGSALAGFGYGLSRYGAGPRARTMAFMTLTTSQLLYALPARSRLPLGDPRLARNPLLERVVAASVLAQLGTVMLPPLRAVLRTAPLSPLDLAVSAALALAPPALHELAKRRAS